MIFVGVALIILVPLAFVAGMSWLVSSMEDRLGFWSTFVTYILLILSTVEIFMTMWLVIMMLGWTH